jgi:trigger factor
MPEFDLPDLEGIEIAKPLLEVTDEQVDGEIEKLRINEGDLEQRDEPEAGDYLTGHGIMTDGSDDDEFYNIEGAVVRVPTEEDEGRGMILGVMVEDFEKQLGLPKPGETATVKVKGPQNHEREDIRGKDLVVTFKVTRVDRIIPAPMADIVAKLGYESEDEVKEMFKTRLGQRVLVNQQSAMRQQVANHLLENTEMELPERLTAGAGGAPAAAPARRDDVPRRRRDGHRAADRRDARRVERAGRPRAQAQLHPQQGRRRPRGQASQEAEVNGRIAQMAAERGARPDQLRQQLIESRQINAVVQQIREHKTIDAIIAKAKVEEMSADDFEKKFADKD